MTYLSVTPPERPGRVNPWGTHNSPEAACCVRCGFYEEIQGFPATGGGVGLCHRGEIKLDQVMKVFGWDWCRFYRGRRLGST